MTFHDCCEAILREAKKPALAYAVGYACAGALITEPNAQRVQALYILNNIRGWRGDEARTVRAALKQIGGVK